MALRLIIDNINYIFENRKYQDHYQVDELLPRKNSGIHKIETTQINSLIEITQFFDLKFEPLETLTIRGTPKVRIENSFSGDVSLKISLEQGDMISILNRGKLMIAEHPRTRVKIIND